MAKYWFNITRLEPDRHSEATFGCGISGFLFAPCEADAKAEIQRRLFSLGITYDDIALEEIPEGFVVMN